MKRIALVGTGNISAFHLRSYAQYQDRCQVVALVDIIPEKAYAKREEYGLNCDVYDDHHALLNRDDIDLVDICTPPYAHAEIAINCLRSGKNVLVEKPMGASLEECDQMLAAAKESGKTLSSIAQNRFVTANLRLKEMLDSGMAGPIKHAQVDSFWWRGHCYYDLWWRGLWTKEGGGCTLNHAVHHVDLLIWMMGLPEQVTSVLANVAHDNAEVEDLSIAIASYPGALAQLTSSVVHHGQEQKMIFQCEKARISMPWSVYASTSMENGFPIRNTELEAALQAAYDALPTLDKEGHAGQIGNVLDSLETGNPPAITGQDGRNTIELITAIYKAGATGQPVQLPIQPDDAFYTTEGMISAMPHFYEKTTAVESLGDGNITTSTEQA